jgi:hypothetical protein
MAVLLLEHAHYMQNYIQQSMYMLTKKETATVCAIHLLNCRGNGTARSFKKNDVVKGNEPVVSSLLTAPHKEIADKPS